MGRLVLLALVCALTAVLPAVTAAPARAQTPPAAGHVVTILLGDHDFRALYGRRSGVPYLARTLRARGALWPAYSAISRSGLSNRVALVSGQPPTDATRAACPRFDCAYAADVKTLPDQLEATGRSWKGYFQDLPAPCPVPQDGRGDPFRSPTKASQYLTRDNPFVYFHSITDRRAACLEHVVPLRGLKADLRTVATTPAWSLVVPDRCASGMATTCPDPRQKGGAQGVERFLRRWVPRILAAPAFERDGLLVITSGAAAASAGRVGALLIGPAVTAGAEFRAAVDHVSYLRSLQDLFGLPPLGSAAGAGVATFQSLGGFAAG